MKKYIAAVIFALSASQAFAGWTDSAVPSRVDLDRGNGFMVWGDFGNPNSCQNGDQFYVNKDHPQYKEIYSMVLTAIVSGRMVKAYITSCEQALWYSSNTTNTMKGADSVIQFK